MRNCILFLVLSVCLSGSLFAYDWSSNPGDGSVENPYQISDPNHLISIGSDPNLLDKHYVLMNDIEFDPNNNPNHVFDRALIAPDTDATMNEFQGSYFTGSFDGANHKIINLVIDTIGSNDYLGLFGLVSRASVSNLGIEKGYIDGDVKIGLLAGYSSGSIENCYSTGTVRGDTWCGGLIGLSNKGTTLGSFSSCSVIGNQRLGGLNGTCVGGSVTNCYAVGSVKGPENWVGGLVGRNYRCDIVNSYATGDVEGGSWVGGLLGYSYDCIVTRSYATGEVKGDDKVGGLVGYNSSTGELSNCYATGAVSGDISVGGLAGSNEMDVSRCYSIGIVKGNQWVGCLIGYNFYQDGFGDGVVSDSFWLINSPIPGIGGDTGTVINVTGKTSGQMKSQNTFTGSPANWDFVGDSNGNNDIWRMCVDGVDYPRLNWEFALDGDFACGDGVDFADQKAIASNWLMLESDDPLLFNYACDANRDGKISP